MMKELGKALVVAGIALALFGALLWTGWGKGWLGRLPGDIHVEGRGFSVHFPLVTCLLLSAMISIALWLVRR